MDYKKLAEAPVFRGLSERFLENFIGRTPNALREFGIGDFIALQMKLLMWFLMLRVLLQLYVPLHIATHLRPFPTRKRNNHT